MSSTILDGWRLAVGTLTVLPTRPPSRVDAAVARIAGVVAPLAVTPVAAAAAVVGWLLVPIGLPSLVAGLLMVAVTTWLTRAIHLDGLADTADGLGSGRPPEQALAIMKRGDVGPMGVVTLIVVMGLQVACVSGLLARPGGAALAGLAICAGRGALAVAARHGVPAARRDGLGAAFASSTPVSVAVGLWVVLAGLLSAASLLSGRPWWQGLLAAVLAVAAIWYLVRSAVRRLGGITGDVLGASVEVATTVLLVALVP